MNRDKFGLKHIGGFRIFRKYEQQNIKKLDQIFNLISSADRFLTKGNIFFI